MEQNTTHSNDNTNRYTAPDSESDLQQPRTLGITNAPKGRRSFRRFRRLVILTYYKICSSVVPWKPLKSLAANSAVVISRDLVEKPDASSILSIRKDLLFILIFVGIIFAAYLSPLKQYMDKAPEICEQIKATGFMAPAIFILGVCILVCIGVPRLLLCPLGGMAFGFFFGLMYCVIGTLVAYYTVFLFVRWGGRGFILRHSHKLNRFTKILDHGGIPAVILVRQMPVHGMVLNLMLGLSPVRHRDFLIGTAIGLFPEAIPFTLIGKGVKQGSLGKIMIYIVVAMLVLVILWLGVKLWSRRGKRYA